MYTHYDLFKHVLYVQFSNYCDQVILEDQSFLALNGIDYKIYNTVVLSVQQSFLQFSDNFRFNPPSLVVGGPFMVHPQTLEPCVW